MRLNGYRFFSALRYLMFCFDLFDVTPYPEIVPFCRTEDQLTALSKKILLAVSM